MHLRGRKRLLWLKTWIHELYLKILKIYLWKRKCINIVHQTSKCHFLMSFIINTIDYLALTMCTKDPGKSTAGHLVAAIMEYPWGLGSQSEHGSTLCIGPAPTHRGMDKNKTVGLMPCLCTTLGWELSMLERGRYLIFINEWRNRGK